MSYIQAAFTPETWYVCLLEKVPFYGGPEEGGWWGTDTRLLAYQQFPSDELAIKAAKRVRKLAEKLELDARQAHNEHCAREIDRRGLDSDFLPEPDGPSKFEVFVSDELPQDSRGCRHYE